MTNLAQTHADLNRRIRRLRIGSQIQTIIWLTASIVATIAGLLLILS
jgi:hypothetical protein